MVGSIPLVPTQLLPLKCSTIQLEYFTTAVISMRVFSIGAITNRVAKKLQNFGIPHLIVSHDYLDVSLQYRVDTANWYHKNYKSGIFVSSHANASVNNLARGFEVYHHTWCNPIRYLR